MIRLETPADYFEVENLVREAFWGQSQPKADEHYLTHKLRSSKDFIPELDLVYEVDGKIVAHILYTKATIVDGEQTHEVLTFGPLSTLPNRQNQGYGKKLLEYSIEKAKELGYPAIVIFGEPDYYPKFGFRPASIYQITTATGTNFDAFMVYVLDREKMTNIRGAYHESPDFQMDEADVAAFDKKFPAKEPAERPKISVLKEQVSASVYGILEDLVAELGELHRFSSRELWELLDASQKEKETINRVLKENGYHAKQLNPYVRFIADSADIVGDVILGKEVTVWFQSVIRGDSNYVRIGNRTNIQDGTIVHIDHHSPVVIGDDVTVGHQCIIHGCKIEKGALIGMGTTILNDAVIGENSLIGAGSLVTEGKVIPPNVLAFGRPAKVIRPLTEEEIAKNLANTLHYVELGYEFNDGLYPAYK